MMINRNAPDPKGRVFELSRKFTSYSRSLTYGVPLWAGEAFQLDLIGFMHKEKLSVSSDNSV